MAYDAPERKTNRFPGHNYRSAGMYFVTIMTRHRICWFGYIQDREMQLNEFGEHAAQCWKHIPQHYPHIQVHEFVVMPNHIHGILEITWDPVWSNDPVGNNNLVGNNNYCSLLDQRNKKTFPWQTKWGKSVSSAIRGLKIGVVKFALENPEYNDFAWQKSFHDRVIRDSTEYSNMRRYILSNPENWDEDLRQ